MTRTYRLMRWWTDTSTPANCWRIETHDTGDAGTWLPIVALGDHGNFYDKNEAIDALNALQTLQWSDTPTPLRAWRFGW